VGEEGVFSWLFSFFNGVCRFLPFFPVYHKSKVGKKEAKTVMDGSHGRSRIKSSSYKSKNPCPTTVFYVIKHGRK
jgi:hypothetical protein